MSYETWTCSECSASLPWSYESCSGEEGEYGEATHRTVRRPNRDTPAPALEPRETDDAVGCVLFEFAERFAAGDRPDWGVYAERIHALYTTPSPEARAEVSERERLEEIADIVAHALANEHGRVAPHLHRIDALARCNPAPSETQEVARG